MDFRCPHCKYDLENRKVSLKYFKAENGVMVSGNYYQCPSCNSLLTKREHPIEKNFRLIPALIYAYIVNFIIWSTALGFSIESMYIFILSALMIFLSSSVFWMSGYVKKRIPKDWSCWVLYARAKL